MPSLKTQLRRQLKDAKRIAVLGIGSSVKGDDAAGVFLIRELKTALRRFKKRRCLRLFSCATAPENCTGAVKKFKPTHIIIVDAVSMRKRAGRTLIVDPAQAGGNVSFSTHSLPLAVLIDYLRHFLNCRVITIGIQPKSAEFGAPLSPPVSKSVKKIVKILVDNFLHLHF